MKEKIIQFGEGNFLRGFADYFIHKLNEKKLFDGSVVIIKPTDRGNVDAFKVQNCEYNLFLRGIENGKQVTEHTKITSISRIINPYEDWQTCLKLAKNPDIEFVISNTTEAGIVFDEKCRFEDLPPKSFPAKLTVMLYERFIAGFGGLVILPCELIDNNGAELQKCVLRYTQQWKLGEDFYNWIITENKFCNTLVDRIVTGYPKDEAEELCRQIGYEDKLLDAAEIFHLWVIEGNFEDKLPLQKAGFNVVWTDDVKPYKRRKVRLLNGAHTSMVCAAILAGVQTVRECMADEDIYSFMNKCVYDEILKAVGESEEDIAFAKAVYDRFRNPYIKHQLRSIVLNCVSKFSVRVLPSMLDYKAKFGEYPKALTMSLSALIYFYKNDTPNDDEKVIGFMKTNSVDDILKNTNLWGRDLSELSDNVNDYYKIIEKQGIRACVKEII